MYAIVMAGGSGTRFWPLSRRQRPKQMLALFGDQSMIAQTVGRLAPLISPKEALVVTAGHLVHDVLADVNGLPAQNVLAEPAGRNTAPCIALATRIIARRAAQAGAGDPVIGVFAADHHIADPAAFRAAIAQAAGVAAETDAIVTLGIQPTRPETGYGYIQMGAVDGDSRQVVQFVEKPDKARAESYLAGGDHLWNAGLFFYRASVMQAELDRQLPNVAATIASIVDGDADGFEQRLADLFPTVQSVSIDYGVMEGAKNVRVVPARCGWNDVGHFGALQGLLDTDDDGNVTVGDNILRECGGSVVINDVDGHLVAVVGAEDLVVVHTDGATLVIPRTIVQDVRHVVTQLRARGRDDVL
jgi:mannose-1-phosphate guanylyltransferase